MKQRNVFITGYPGFLGSKVVELLLHENKEEINSPVTIKVLVQPSFVNAAQKAISELPKTDQGQISIVEGDICEKQLGLDDHAYRSLTNEINEIFHMAALYRLDAEEYLSKKVNVIGTQNMISFALDLKEIRVFNHISSIVVSGKRTGVVFEDELEHDMGFHNHYDKTKHLSEVVVKNYMDRLPIIVFRPAVIVGDSKTGAIPKIDGPYFIIRTFLKLQKLPSFLVPVLGDYSYTPFHMAPVDFVAKAMTYLSAQPDAIGKTFHLVDKHPLTINEFFTLIHEKIWGGQNPRVLPEWVMKRFDKIPARLVNALGVSKNSIAYLNQVPMYDTKNTDELLKGSDISCPSVYDYIDHMIDFVRNNPDIPLSI